MVKAPNNGSANRNSASGISHFTVRRVACSRLPLRLELPESSLLGLQDHQSREELLTVAFDFCTSPSPRFLRHRSPLCLPFFSAWIARLCVCLWWKFATISRGSWIVSTVELELRSFLLVGKKQVEMHLKFDRGLWTFICCLMVYNASRTSSAAVCFVDMHIAYSCLSLTITLPRGGRCWPRTVNFSPSDGWKSHPLWRVSVSDEVFLI